MALPPADEVVDAEFTPVQEYNPRAAQTRAGVVDISQPEPLVPTVNQELAPATMDLEQRARALGLFVKIPVFAYVALNRDVHPLVRLAALGLGIMEATAIARQQEQIQQMMPDLPGVPG